MYGNVRFSGVIPAIVTPFTREGALDLDTLRDNVAWWIDGGSTGLVVTGTVGEAATLTRSERRAVAETVVDVSRGRIPVTVGVSAVDAETVKTYAADAAEVGAAALMVLPPLLYEGDERETVGFYTAVAAGSELAIMVYNNPKASGGHDLSPETILRIADEVEQVIAVKECSGDARRIASLVEHPDLDVLVGGDDWALEAFFAGAVGWVSGAANVAPRECVKLYELCLAGEAASARRLYQSMLPLCRLDMTPKLVQFFKAGLEIRGRSAGPCRPPRMPLTDQESSVLQLALDRIEAAGAPG